MRLTNKETKIKLSDTKRYDLQDHKMFTKLSQLEDIEEELGIDLLTLFKILKDGMFIKQHSDMENRNIIHPFNYPSLFYGRESNLDIKKAKICSWGFHIIGNWNIRIKDYGKTWALTKEELESL